ncbi:MAG: DUF2071 domain-containing protein [SAR324 cluster bacterium]|nr:DUF2071 domain-containing protein [SAR324 cluster bacterium]MCH8887561.1 DUF2071 domain-containing protein [SAR324 cluster bacterium]
MPETDLAAPGLGKVFLTAGWRHLLLLNYATDPGVLEPLLPPGCELDFYEGRPYVSLVAFQFKDTKVLGVKWPGFINFPEVNLRFYVRYRGERGVCFVREHVPSRLLAWIARTIYHEPYKKAVMTEAVTAEAGGIAAAYHLKDGRHGLSLKVRARNQPTMPPENSMEHFFKEHELGVGTGPAGDTLTYRVHHPHWRVFPIETFTVSIDGAGLYGERFAFLSGRPPDSVVFAEGSQIVVYGKGGRRG